MNSTRDPPRLPTLAAVPDALRTQSESSTRLRDLLRAYRIGAGARVLREFAEFAGSHANVAGLLTGLAWGAPITLRSDDEESRAVTFTSPALPMRNYDVYVCLSLVRRELAALGIPRPQPEQIRATLLRVIALRAQGMTWSSTSDALQRASGVRYR